MSTKLKIALIGDYDENIIAHQCIPKAIHLAAEALSIEAEPLWIETKAIGSGRLDQYDGIWCTPGSPYKDRLAVLDAIRFARSHFIPYLGTCGGYQHAILEFAKNSLGYHEAELEEENPNAAMPLISALSCRLDSARRKIRIDESSVSQHLGTKEIEEEYQCGFGMNPIYRPLFEKSALKFVAFNDENVPQAFELSDHPFFIGTAFQPERSARVGKSHSLIEAFLRCSLKF